MAKKDKGFLANGRGACVEYPDCFGFIFSSFAYQTKFRVAAFIKPPLFNPLEPFRLAFHTFLIRRQNKNPDIIGAFRRLVGTKSLFSSFAPMKASNKIPI
jgi:hypothetical protein